MIVCKYFLLFFVFSVCTLIGFKISKKYNERAKNLKEIKKGLKYLEAKIVYTYELLPDLFLEVSKKVDSNVGKLFLETSKRMSLEFADEAWGNSLEACNLNLLDDDKEVLKSLGKLLGSTDIDGQVKHLKMVNKFLDAQINEACELRNVNEKLYKKLGIIIGVACVIVLA